jgi:hypothetical protein
MLVQPRPSTQKGVYAWILALLAGLILGVAFGVSWQRDLSASPAQQPSGIPTGAPTAGGGRPEDSAPREVPPRPVGTGAEQEQSSPTFAQLEITVAPEDWARIVAHRERSVAENIITRDDDAIVPAQVRVGQQSTSGTVRLKGDWPDHVLSKQWSLRFELEEPLMGMRRFSIQHPATRHLIMEWLAMKTSRRVGLLTPHCDFVHATINDQEPGFYYLEEHPSKELLESQGRRDGPIVKFDESKMWDTWRQFMGESIPPEIERVGVMSDAPPVAFSEKRLRQSEALNARLMRALEQIDALRLLTIGDDSKADRLRRLHSMQQLVGKTIDDVFDTEQAGKWLALNTLFNGHHGQGWHQLRFYHNPMTDRLEPVVFDTGAEVPMGPTELAMHVGAGRQFLKSPRVTLAAFEELTRMTEPGWLEESTTALLPYIKAVREAFAAQPDPFNGFFKLDPSFDLATQFEGKAKAMVKYRDTLRKRLAPDAAANFASTMIMATDQNGLTIPMVEVDAWSCTAIPVRVEAFVFSNGKRVPAAAALTGISDLPDSLDDLMRLPDGGVLLLNNGSPLRFRIPADQRLLGLNQVQNIKRAIRNGVAPKPERLPKIEVVYRPVGAKEGRQERLTMRRQPTGREIAEGRPTSPSLVEALEQHPFLEFDIDFNRLSVSAGRHMVQGDLLLPENQILHLKPGTELLFAPGAVAVVGALNALGTAEAPIRFGPQEPSDSFAGLLSLGTAGPNLLEFVEFSRTTGIQRGAWQTTGGVTLTGHSRAVLQNCTFRDALGEDSLNVVGVTMHCADCTFDGGVSDLLDGDFVNGTVIGCKFLNSDSDALDVSGSVLKVERCHFARIGDKALSIGEGSRVEASDCHVESAMIAASSKDRSTVSIDRLKVDEVERFVAVAYIKKPQFGPASITVNGLTWGGAAEPAFLVQTSCAMQIDGREIPQRDIDVKALYEQKILGK